MSRATAGETITVKPTSNVYTVLVICSVVIEIVGIIALVMRYAELFPGLPSGQHLFF